MQIGDYVAFARDGILIEGQRKDLWKVTKINPIKATIESITGDDYFTTDLTNLIGLKDLTTNNLLNKSNFKSSALEKINNFTESMSMNINKNKNDMVKRTVSANTEAAKIAATIATGRTVNNLLITKFKDQIPMLVRGYADSPVGAVVIANMFDFGIKQFTPDNVKFNYVSEAMMQAAMVDLLDQFDFEGIMNDVLSGVTLGEVSES